LLEVVEVADGFGGGDGGGDEGAALGGAAEFAEFDAVRALFEGFEVRGDFGPVEDGAIGAHAVAEEGLGGGRRRGGEGRRKEESEGGDTHRK